MVPHIYIVLIPTSHKFKCFALQPVVIGHFETNAVNKTNEILTSFPQTAMDSMEMLLISMEFHVDSVHGVLTTFSI